MSDVRRPAGHADPAFDAEIDSRSFAVFGIWLAVAIVLIIALMYWMYRDFQKDEVSLDAPVSPLVDRAKPHVPPGPHLQVTPEIDLQTYRGEQQQAVGTYGWVDESMGVVHVPVQRAMDLLLEKGVPSRAAAPLSSQASAPSPAPSIPLPVPAAPSHPAVHPAGGGHP